MSKAMRQNSEKVERTGVISGEAEDNLVRDEACGPQWDSEGTGSALLEAMLTRGNLRQAWKRVKANTGAAGVDGREIAETAEWLKTQ
ncbi:MAG: hypothetical protein QNK31_03370 [Porticoccus sp.]|nr:hypothetical protein [Porticoccus sp.]